MPSGVLSGWLEKRGNGGLLGSAFRARWFVLDTEGTVRYYKVQPTKASDVPQGYFNVQGAEMHTTSGAEFDVAVQELIEGQAGAARTQTRRVFHIRAESVMARDRWLAALQAAAGGKASSLNWSALAALQVPLASDDSDRDLASSSVPHLPTPPPQVVQDLSVPSLPAAGDDLASTEQLMGCISLQGSSLPSTPPPAPCLLDSVMSPPSLSRMLIQTGGPSRPPLSHMPRGAMQCRASLSRMLIQTGGPNRPPLSHMLRGTMQCDARDHARLTM